MTYSGTGGSDLCSNCPISLEPYPSCHLCEKPKEIVVGSVERQHCLRMFLKFEPNVSGTAALLVGAAAYCIASCYVSTLEEGSLDFVYKGPSGWERASASFSFDTLTRAALDCILDILEKYLQVRGILVEEVSIDGRTKVPLVRVGSQLQHLLPM